MLSANMACQCILVNIDFARVNISSQDYDNGMFKIIK